MTPDQARVRHGRWSLCEALFWPLGLLVMAPAITHLRSLEAYGTVLLLTAVCGAAPLLMAGTQQVLIQRLGGRGDSSLTDDTVGSAVVLTAITLVLVAVIAAVWLVVGVVDISGAQAGTAHRTSFAFACAAGAAGAAIDQFSLGVLKGRSLFRRSALMELFSRSLQILGAVLTAAWVASDTAPAIAVGFAALVGGVTRFIAATREVQLTIPSRPLGSAFRVLRSGWWMLLGSLGGYFYMSLDRVIVGGLLGPRALAIYGVGVQLAQFSHMLPAAYFQPMAPHAARLHEQRNSAEIRRLTRASTLKGTMTVLLISVLTACGAPILIDLGLHQKFSVDGLVMLILCITASAVMGASAPVYYMLVGMGRFAAVSIAQLFAGMMMAVLLVSMGTGGSLAEAAAVRVLAAALMAGSFWLAFGRAIHSLDSPDVPAAAVPKDPA